MTVVLASAWNPRGELSRFERLYAVLKGVYQSMTITLPPDADAEAIKALEAMPLVNPVRTPQWPVGRYLALRLAAETGADYIHYADFDRLLRWVETGPDEWRRTVQTVQQSDCLVIGRTAQAWATHPKALQETEMIPNRLFSHLLGRELDLSAGSKGFSRAAAGIVTANATPDRPMGADSEWVVIAHRAGFTVDTIQVNGLDWESADRYQAAAANGDAQREAALRYDEEAANWAMRVGVAAEIVQVGLEAMARPLIEHSEGRV